MKDRLFRFPANARAAELTRYEQARKVLEEAEEIMDAVFGEEGEARIIEEAWDCICAVEGVLRKFPAHSVLIGLARVKVKNSRRGDW